MICLKLQEKDLNKQYDDLIYQIKEMGKLQKELISKQNELLNKQKALEEKKQQLQKTDEDSFAKLEKDNLKLKELALKDPLTNMYNRRYFEKEIEKRLLKANQQNSSLTMLMIDLDFFKEINDTYGHLAGRRSIKGGSCYYYRIF
jgi:PleD family two-component response regulator